MRLHKHQFSQRTEKGVAAVELAASLPFVVLFMILVVQFGVVMFDQLAVTNAAREGAREAAVSANPADAVYAAKHATGLNTANMNVAVGSRPASGGLISVTVRYKSRIVMPFTGSVIISPIVSGKSSMMVEGQ